MRVTTMITGTASRTHSCPHVPTCPAASAPGREQALTLVRHAEQGWSLLCNGVVLFDDTGELLPNGVVIPPRRPHERAG